MLSYQRIILTVVVFTAVFLTGCATHAPLYQPDFNLVNDLKDSNMLKSAIGEFKDSSPAVNNVSLRGVSLESPYNKSYGAYLSKALEEQLKQANLFDSSAKISISGELLKNDISVMGFSIGEADLSAKFVVTKESSDVYSKIHTIHHEWPSSFVGAIAVENGKENYPVAVQKLLKQLLTDAEFIQSLK